MLNAREDHRSDIVEAIDLGDGQIGRGGADDADSGAEQDSELVGLRLHRLPVEQGSGPMANIKARGVDVEQQFRGLDVEHGCDCAEFRRIGKNLAPFDLRQANIGNAVNDLRQRQ